MLIDKPFWLKETASTKQAYSYDNNSNVNKFVKQYGGLALPSLELSDEVAQHIPETSDVYSVLVNTSPEIIGVGAANQRRFKVLTMLNGVYSYYDDGHPTLRDANTAAKSISKYYDVIIVLKERVTELDKDEAIAPELVSAGGVFA